MFNSGGVLDSALGYVCLKGGRHVLQSRIATHILMAFSVPDFRVSDTVVMTYMTA